jgi:hypothetical protein
VALCSTKAPGSVASDTQTLAPLVADNAVQRSIHAVYRLLKIRKNISKNQNTFV